MIEILDVRRLLLRLLINLLLLLPRMLLSRLGNVDDNFFGLVAALGDEGDEKIDDNRPPKILLLLRLWLLLEPIIKAENIDERLGMVVDILVVLLRLFNKC